MESATDKLQLRLHEAVRYECLSVEDVERPKHLLQLLNTFGRKYHMAVRMGALHRLLHQPVLANSTYRRGHQPQYLDDEHGVNIGEADGVQLRVG